MCSVLAHADLFTFQITGSLYNDYKLIGTGTVSGTLELGVGTTGPATQITILTSPKLAG